MLTNEVVVNLFNNLNVLASSKHTDKFQQFISALDLKCKDSCQEWLNLSSTAKRLKVKRF